MRSVYLSAIFSLFGLIRYTLSNRVKFYSVVFINKISTQVVWYLQLNVHN